MSNQVQNNPAKEQENLSTELAVLSLIIPIVGYVLFFVYRNKSRVKSRMAGLIALIGSAIAALIYLWNKYL